MVDNGSTDATAWRARQAGARVVSEPRRGYGRACAAGFAAIGPRADIVCFLDGDGSDVPRFIRDVVRPIVENRADFVMGSRLRGERETGSMTPQQLVAGHMAGFLLRLFYGVRFTDMSPFRAMPAAKLAGLGMTETTYGWNLEMQMRVAAAGLRIVGNSRRPSLPARRRIESVGTADRRAQRRLEDFDDIRPSALFAEKSRIGGDKTRYAAATSRRK